MDGFWLLDIVVIVDYLFVQVVVGQFIKDTEILRRIDGHANTATVEEIVAETVGNISIIRILIIRYIMVLNGSHAQFATAIHIDEIKVRQQKRQRVQFHIDAVMKITHDMCSIKDNRLVSSIRIMNAISTTNRHQTFIGAETAEDSRHAPIGYAIAYVDTEVGIVERRVSLHQTRIAHVDFEIALVERF